MTNLQIRSASLADAEAIARVHVLSWQSAYQGLLPDDMLANLSVEQRGRQWAQWLQENSERQVLVGVQPGVQDKTEQIVGFACGGPERTANPDYTGEIYAIYLLPEAQGLGLGRSLFVALQAKLKTRGLGTQLVWVLSTNKAACGFYEALGGKVVLERKVPIGTPAVEVDETAYGYHP